MSDLRDRFRTLDRLPVPDLWADVERRAMAGATGAAVRVDATLPTWRRTDPTTPATRRMVLLLALLGLLTLAGIGAAMVGGLLPDPLRAVLPPAVPSTTASPRFVHASPTAPREAESPPRVESPTALLEPEPFRSAIHGYSLRPPTGWYVAPATEAWSGLDPWSARMADIFSPRSAGRRLTVVSTALPDGITGDAWIEAHSPARPVQARRPCMSLGGAGMITEGARDSTTDSVIDGRPAQLRTICGHITGTVIVDDRVVQLSLNGGRPPDGDRVLFDQIMATVDFDPPAPVPAASFKSERNGYVIEVPEGWTAAAATEPWISDGRPGADAVDTFVGPTTEGSPRLTVAARSKPDEMSEDRFVADVAPLPDKVRLDGPEVVCAFDHAFVERGPITPWAIEVIGGHRAQRRAMCGTVDAVVFVGGRGYLFTFESGEQTTGDLERFHELAASIRFDDGREMFVSHGYGYSVRIPADWRVTPATAPWSGTIADEGLDRFMSSAGGSGFNVGAHSVDPGVTEEAWIDAFVPRIAELHGRDCWFGRTHVLAPDADATWHSGTIDGRRARVRAACGRVDGVVFDDGIGYWLRLVTSERRTGADVAAFDLFADTIDLDAAPATWLSTETAVPETKAFTSRRYGYTVQYPDDWTVTPAPRRKPGEALDAGRTPDEFVEPGETPKRFTVLARPLVGDLVDDAWLGSFVPEPIGYEGRACHTATGTHMDANANSASSWAETTVAGRAARIRLVCGDTQAVTVVGDVAYVLWLATPGIADSTSSFRQIADTFRIAP